MPLHTETIGEIVKPLSCSTPRRWSLLTLAVFLLGLLLKIYLEFQVLREIDCLLMCLQKQVLWNVLDKELTKSSRTP